MSNDKPVSKFRFGSISAAIWENETVGDDGEPKTWATVTLQRVYKDKDGNFQNTDSLRLQDIPKAVAVLQAAYTQIGLKHE